MTTFTPPRPVAQDAFANGYEMAGYYAAHMLYLLDTTHKAPMQLAFLGGEPEILEQERARLASVFNYGQIGEFLQQNRAQASAAAMVWVNRRDVRESNALLVEVMDFTDGLQAAITVPYRQHVGRHRLKVGDPDVVDLVGVEEDEIEIARMGCLLDFMMGMQKHAQAENRLMR